MDSIQAETEELSSSPFGQTLLTTIGRVYREYAVSETSVTNSFGVGLTQASRSVRRGFSIASEGISAAYTATEVNKLQKAAQRRASAPPSTNTDGTTTSGPQAGADASTTTSSPPPPPSESKSEERPSESNNPTEGKLTAEEQELLTKKIEKLSGHMFAVM